MWDIFSLRYYKFREKNRTVRNEIKQKFWEDEILGLKTCHDLKNLPELVKVCQNL